MKKICIQEVSNGWVLTFRISTHELQVVCTDLKETEQCLHTWLTENPNKILSEE